MAGGIITKLVVAFDKPLNPTTAVNLVNYGYSVRTAGRDHIFGTPDDLIIPLFAAVYNPSNRTVTLKLERGIDPPTPFLFTINESTSVSGGGDWRLEPDWEPARRQLQRHRRHSLQRDSQRQDSRI